MSKVEIDDLDCPNCNQITMGELDLKEMKYTCMKCNKIIEGEE